MSEDSLKSMLKIPERRPGFASDPRPVTDENEYQAFSFGRVGVKPQLMLEFQKTDGFHLVLPYLDIRAISSSKPAKGFVIEFAGRKITIEGNHLGVCYRYLKLHRVSELIEADRGAALQKPEDATVITAIRFAKPE